VSEVVERIAKKVAEFRRCELDCWNCGLGCMCYIDAHSLVAEFLREPTEAMVRAGENQQREFGPIYGYHTDRIWRAMIDEVLK
jgi:hypothetical protein